METQPRAKIKKATTYDYTSYEAGKSSNGGAYGFWTKYSYIGEGRYEVHHGTTADFEYCPYCGNFGDCDCDIPDVVKEAEVWQAIKDALKESSSEIYAEYELFKNHKEWVEKLRRRVRDALNKTVNDTQIINCAFNLDVKVF